MGWGFLQRLPSRYSKNITIVLICTKEDALANPCFLFENLCLPEDGYIGLNPGMPGSEPTTTQEVGRSGGGYRQLSYIHLLSTLEKAAIDAGVNVPKLLDDSEVGAEAVNTITDL